MDGQCAAATLGADRNANKDDVRRAFRARAKELHPDSGPHGSESAFIALRQAFEILMASAPEVAQSATSTGGSQAASPQRARAFETSASSSTAHSVDLADTDRRVNVRPKRQPGRRTSQQRQPDHQAAARGIKFADHLAAAMAS